MQEEDECRAIQCGLWHSLDYIHTQLRPRKTKSNEYCTSDIWQPMLFKSLPSFIARRNGSALQRASHVCRKGRPLHFRTCRQRPVTSYVFKYQGEPSRINFFSRRLIMTANTRTIDCIKFGIDGQYTREDIKVIDLLRMTNLHARDLIPLERGSGLGRTASIQPRKNSIVLSVSHLRSIITHDSLYVLEPESFAVKQFVQEFSSSLKSNEHTGDNFGNDSFGIIVERCH